jgi:hypothetical protein
MLGSAAPPIMRRHWNRNRTPPLRFQRARRTARSIYGRTQVQGGFNWREAHFTKRCGSRPQWEQAIGSCLDYRGNVRSASRAAFVTAGGKESGSQGVE